DLIAIIGKEGEDFQALLSAEANEPEEEKTAEPKTSASVAEPPKNTEKQAKNTDTSRVKISPLAKAIAKEKGLDVASLQGSGEDGRIVKRDLENVNKSSVNFVPAMVSGEESFTDIRVSQMRKTIARRLSDSVHNAPHFYLSMDVLMDKAVALRSELNA